MELFKFSNLCIRVTQVFTFPKLGYSLSTVAVTSGSLRLPEVSDDSPGSPTQDSRWAA